MANNPKWKSSRPLRYMRRLGLGEWVGPVSPAAYARGVSASLDNARSLLDDARLLMEAKRHPRAVALAMLALEESDKLRLLFLLCMGAPTKAHWKAFRDHRRKLSSSLRLLTHEKFSLFGSAAASASPPPKAAKWLRDLPNLSQVLKLRCLYVDRLRDGSWSVPSRIVPPVFTAGLLSLAAYLLVWNTSWVLAAELTVAGQQELVGLKKVNFDWSEASPCGRRWMRWRSGKAGQAWGAREWKRHGEWVARSTAPTDSTAYAQTATSTPRRTA